MSSMLITVPRSSMKATDSAIRVFFIHMHCADASSNMNSMPALEAMALRYIRPWARLAKSAATSA